MFLHDTHLPHVLSPWAYTSQEQLDREIEVLFKPAWHLAGSFAELPKDGDFLTTTILNHPVILWRSGGEYQAFLNVCPHRFSQLSCATKGHCEPHLHASITVGNSTGTGTRASFPMPAALSP